MHEKCVVSHAKGFFFFFFHKSVLHQKHWRCSWPKAAKAKQQDSSLVVTKGHKGWCDFAHGKNQVIRWCSLVKIHESIYSVYILREEEMKTRTNWYSGAECLPAVSCWRASTKCNPAGALTVSRLNTDAVLGITLSIAFSQLRWVEKVTFGFLLNSL